MLKVKRERCRRLHAFRLSVGTPKCASSASPSFIPHMRRNSIRGFNFAPQTTLCFCYKTCHWHTCGIHDHTHVHAAIELAHLRNLTMPAHKKSRRVTRTQATSCPKLRGNLGQILASSTTYKSSQTKQRRRTRRWNCSHTKEQVVRSDIDVAGASSCGDCIHGQAMDSRSARNESNEVCRAVRTCDV